MPQNTEMRHLVTTSIMQLNADTRCSKTLDAVKWFAEWGGHQMPQNTKMRHLVTTSLMQ